MQTIPSRKLISHATPSGLEWLCMVGYRKVAVRPIGPDMVCQSFNMVQCGFLLITISALQAATSPLLSFTPTRIPRRKTIANVLGSRKPSTVGASVGSLTGHQMLIQASTCPAPTQRIGLVHMAAMHEMKCFDAGHEYEEMAIVKGNVMQCSN